LVVGVASGRGGAVSAEVKQEAEVAVAELRLFMSLYDGVELVPDSRTAKQLEAAQRTVAAYDDVVTVLAAEDAA
jgi:hypothetical protein